MFSKKIYCGVAHKDTADFGDRKKISISGLSMKKRGNAKVLKDIGDDILDRILSPKELSSIPDLISTTLDKHLDSIDIDKFTITETFRQKVGDKRGNVKILSFVNSLPDGYSIDNLSKFDYVFIKRDKLDKITGNKIDTRRSDHMMLK